PAAAVVNCASARETAIDGEIPGNLDGSSLNIKGSGNDTCIRRISHRQRACASLCEPGVCGRVDRADVYDSAGHTDGALPGCAADGYGAIIQVQVAGPGEGEVAVPDL